MPLINIDRSVSTIDCFAMPRTILLHISALPIILSIAVLVPCAVRADDPFREQVLPFVKEHCAKCHNDKTSEGELNLTQYTSVEMLGEHFRQWETRHHVSAEE